MMIDSLPLHCEYVAHGCTIIILSLSSNCIRTLVFLFENNCLLQDTPSELRDFFSSTWPLTTWWQAWIVLSVLSLPAFNAPWSMAQHITCIKRITAVLMLQRSPRLLWTSSSALTASTAPTRQSKEQLTWLSAVPWLMLPTPFTQRYTLLLPKP